MIYNFNEKASAVIFIGSEGVIKELLYTEFQAILDGFVALESMLNEPVRAVYLEINYDLRVTAAVFFTFLLDSEGFVERSWNLPLLDLARTAASGPDMGAGPIHLACASQCPVALFKKSMWDPQLASHSSHLALIKKSIKRNKLGIQFKANDHSSTDQSAISAENMRQLSKKLGEQYQAEMRDHMAQLLKDQRLQVATMVTERDKAVESVRLEFIKKLEILQQQLEAKEQELSDTQKRNEELKDTIEGQANKIEGLREYFEQKLERTQTSSVANAAKMTAYNETEVEAKVAVATQEVKELLYIREAELEYRKEHEASLGEELSSLKAQHQGLIESGGDHILDRLSRNGVNFVTYQPGAGHITIPFAQVSLFLESPVAFTARYCGVSEKHYSAWLQHYQAPVCEAPGVKQKICGVGISRITTPAEFVAGESNCCDQHNLLRSVDAVHS